MDSRRASLLAHLEQHLRPPVPDEIVTAAELAIDLTIADHANRLVDLPGGPALAAGTLVEMLDLDAFADER